MHGGTEVRVHLWENAYLPVEIGISASACDLQSLLQDIEEFATPHMFSPYNKLLGSRGFGELYRVCFGKFLQFESGQLVTYIVNSAITE